MFPCFYLPHGKTRSCGHFRLGQVRLDPFQEQVVTQGFYLGWNELRVHLGSSPHY